MDILATLTLFDSGRGVGGEADLPPPSHIRVYVYVYVYVYIFLILSVEEGTTLLTRFPRNNKTSIFRGWGNICPEMQKATSTASVLVLFFPPQLC